MLMVQGALDANSRFTLKSWKSSLSNAQNPGAAKNKPKPEKSKQTQLRETRSSAEETGPKLDVNVRYKPFFQAYYSSMQV
jgi:hypothetical protein